jgi:ribosomal-protein-alanine N-acetyltransferase
MTTLFTPRLRIDELTAEDAPFMLAMLNDPDFITNVADRGVRSLDQARQYISEGPVRSSREHGFGMFAVRLRDCGETVGLCGLVRRPQLEDVDIGYGFLPVGRGRGLAAEAAHRVWEHATGALGLRRLVAIVAPGNAPSIRLLEQLGLRYERDIRLAPQEAPLRLYSWQAGPD